MEQTKKQHDNQGSKQKIEKKTNNASSKGQSQNQSKGNKTVVYSQKDKVETKSAKLAEEVKQATPQSDNINQGQKNQQRVRTVIDKNPKKQDKGSAAPTEAGAVEKTHRNQRGRARQNAASKVDQADADEPNSTARPANAKNSSNNGKSAAGPSSGASAQQQPQDQQVIAPATNKSGRHKKGQQQEQQLETHETKQQRSKSQFNATKQSSRQSKQTEKTTNTGTERKGAKQSQAATTKQQKAHKHERHAQSPHKPQPKAAVEPVNAPPTLSKKEAAKAKAKAKAAAAAGAVKEKEAKAEKPAGEGEYDASGFYIYPDGSFLDSDGYFFDKWGYDELGGFYDDSNIYHPPQNAPLAPIPSKTPQFADQSHVFRVDPPHAGPPKGYRGAKVLPKGQQDNFDDYGHAGYGSEFAEPPVTSSYHSRDGSDSHYGGPQKLYGQHYSEPVNRRPPPLRPESSQADYYEEEHQYMSQKGGAHRPPGYPVTQPPQAKHRVAAKYEHSKNDSEGPPQKKKPKKGVSEDQSVDDEGAPEASSKTEAQASPEKQATTPDDAEQTQETPSAHLDKQSDQKSPLKLKKEESGPPRDRDQYYMPEHNQPREHDGEYDASDDKDHQYLHKSSHDERYLGPPSRWPERHYGTREDTESYYRSSYRGRGSRGSYFDRERGRGGRGGYRGSFDYYDRYRGSVRGRGRGDRGFDRGGYRGGYIDRGGRGTYRGGPLYERSYERGGYYRGGSSYRGTSYRGSSYRGRGRGASVFGRDSYDPSSTDKPYELGSAIPSKRPSSHDRERPSANKPERDAEVKTGPREPAVLLKQSFSSPPVSGPTASSKADYEQTQPQFQRFQSETVGNSMLGGENEEESKGITDASSQEDLQQKKQLLMNLIYAQRLKQLQDLNQGAVGISQVTDDQNASSRLQYAMPSNMTPTQQSDLKKLNAAQSLAAAVSAKDQTKNEDGFSSDMAADPSGENPMSVQLASSLFQNPQSLLQPHHLQMNPALQQQLNPLLMQYQQIQMQQLQQQAQTQMYLQMAQQQQRSMFMGPVDQSKMQLLQGGLLPDGEDGDGNWADANQQDMNQQFADEDDGEFFMNNQVSHGMKPKDLNIQAQPFVPSNDFGPPAQQLQPQPIQIQLNTKHRQQVDLLSNENQNQGFMTPPEDKRESFNGVITLNDFGKQTSASKASNNSAAAHLHMQSLVRHGGSEGCPMSDQCLSQQAVALNQLGGCGSAMHSGSKQFADDDSDGSCVDEATIQHVVNDIQNEDDEEGQ